MFGNAALEEEIYSKIRSAPITPDQSAMLIRILQEVTDIRELTDKKRKHKREITEEDKRRLATGVKSNGVKVAKAADALRSWDDVNIMNNVFLEQKNKRNYLLWILGLSTGLRSVDLRKMKVYNVLDERGNIRDRINTYEQKTSKTQNCLITEVLRNALELYFEQVGELDPDSYLLISQKGKGDTPLDESQLYRIITDAGKKAGIPIHFSCHTMRATFSTIAECVCREYGILRNDPIYLVQGLLNHSDSRTTQRYMRASQKALDSIRMLVSDFILGRTKFKDLDINIGGIITNEDI